MARIITMMAAGVINLEAGLAANDFVGFLKNKWVSGDDEMVHGGNKVTINNLRSIHNIGDSDLIDYPKPKKEADDE